MLGFYMKSIVCLAKNVEYSFFEIRMKQTMIQCFIFVAKFNFFIKKYLIMAKQNTNDQLPLFDNLKLSKSCITAIVGDCSCGKTTRATNLLRKNIHSYEECFVWESIPLENSKYRSIVKKGHVSNDVSFFEQKFKQWINPQNIGISTKKTMVVFDDFPILTLKKPMDQFWKLFLKCRENNMSIMVVSNYAYCGNSVRSFADYVLLLNLKTSLKNTMHETFENRPFLVGWISRLFDIKQIYTLPIQQLKNYKHGLMCAREDNSPMMFYMCSCFNQHLYAKVYNNVCFRDVQFEYQ